ncbi:hypothetical protein TYRP_018701 [Tyrophagus putrescentiae]|nr:hypothetical protein TYRP_018701 [Tyrophagus putrescentiae]
MEVEDLEKQFTDTPKMLFSRAKKFHLLMSDILGRQSGGGNQNAKQISQTAGHFDNFIPTVQITYRVNPLHHYTALAAVVQAQAGGFHMRKEAAKAEPAKLIVRLKVGEVEVQRLKGGDWPEADGQRTGQHTFHRLILPVAVASGKGNGEGQMAKPGKVFRNGGE